MAETRGVIEEGGKGAVKEASTAGPSTSKGAAKASTKKLNAPARKASTSKAGNSKGK